MEDTIREEVEELAKVYFSGVDISVDLLPSIIIGFLIGAGLTRLFQASLLSNNSQVAASTARNGLENQFSGLDVLQQDDNVYETIMDFQNKIFQLQDLYKSLTSHYFANGIEGARADQKLISNNDNSFSSL